MAANIFLGMIESPIVIRAYLDKLTRSELFLMMVVGLATVAGSTMVAYALMLAPTLTNAAGHVLVASIISAPAGILLARIIVPEKPGEGGAHAEYDAPLKYDSAIDAIAKGTTDGMNVAIHIAAILIVMVALVALGNAALSGFYHIGGEPIIVDAIVPPRAVQGFQDVDFAREFEGIAVAAVRMQDNRLRRCDRPGGV